MGGVRKTDKYRLIEKRGQGIGAEYRAWLKVHEFGSTGRVHRVRGWKNNRMYQLMSDLEYYFFLITQWREDVLDIREQYPLLPLEQTLLIANELDVSHPPKNRKEKTVMTTDFVITIKEHNKISNQAIFIKYTDELTNLRVQEKLNIEQAYWQKKNIKHKVITEKDIPKVLAQNLSYIYHGYFWNEDMGLSLKALEKLIKQFLKYLSLNNNEIIDACRWIEKERSWSDGEGINFLKYLLTHKIIKVDLTMPLNYKTMQIMY